MILLKVIQSESQSLVQFQVTFNPNQVFWYSNCIGTFVTLFNSTKSNSEYSQYKKMNEILVVFKVKSTGTPLKIRT